MAERFATRLWKRDPGLWPNPSPGGDPVHRSLGWLDLPEQLPTLEEQFRGLSSKLMSEGFTDVVVLGMGGSSMATLALLESSTSLARNPDHGLRLSTLDTVNPETISRVTETLDLTRTLFFVSSKSGTTIEPLSLEAFFRRRIESQPSRPGFTPGKQNFVALTDSGTPLSNRARAGQFGTWVETPSNVGGRFSALTAFGMMPAAAAGTSIRGFVESASAMACRCKIDCYSNPGLKLGAFLASNALTGRNKVTVISQSQLTNFGLWIEQLLAESTGKAGNGLIPIVGESHLEPDEYGTDRQFIFVDTAPDSPHLRQFATNLESAGHPVITLDPPITDTYSLAGEFFRWEFAITAASSIMSVYPFDQPDVEETKARVRSLLSNPSQPLTTKPLHDSLKSLSTVRPPSYIAILSYLPESRSLSNSFSALRTAISKATGAATMFEYGPRYIHSTGQLYKGGPKNAVILGFISGKYDDLAVPGVDYTFGQLTETQARGDFAAMKDSGQTVITVRLQNDPIGQLTAAKLEIFG